MNKDQKLAIIGLAIAGAITVVSTDGAFDLWDSVVGIVLMISLSYVSNHDKLDREAQSLLAAIWALSFFLVIGWVVELIPVYIRSF